MTRALGMQAAAVEAELLAEPLPASTVELHELL